MSHSTTRATSASGLPRSEPAGKPVFVTTHWSVVVAAGRSDTTNARSALATLCQTYWYPLYAYVRRRGYSAHDAQDLTQEFFARLLQRNDVANVREERGRFRSYLLTALNHFLSDAWDKSRAQKRGAGRTISLDAAEAESRYLQQPVETVTPETLYEQRWAVTLLEEVHRRLREEYRRDRRGALFETLRFSLMGERSAVPYADLARQLDMTEGAVRVAVHRLRQRYRRMLRELIAETVSSGDEIEAELAYLLKTLSRD